jgi:predicted lipoprotein with Yx(FWY)xxD motif
MRIRGWAVAGLGLVVPLLAACGPSSTTPGSAYGSSSATPMTSSSAGSASGMGTSGTTSTGMSKTVTLTIKTTKIGKVLTDSKGDTLYWYAKDMQHGPSTCAGACLSAWPAVAGTPVAAMGVTFAGKLGSVKDANGTVQATYNGYPLYTYAEDMTPGETSGNGAGGVWHVITGQYLVSSMSSGSGSTGSSGSGSSGSGYGSGYGTGSKLSGSSTSGSSAGSAAQNSTSSGSSGSSGSGSGGSTGSTGGSGSKGTNPVPAPVPTSSINGGGCGSGSCW